MRPGFWGELRTLRDGLRMDKEYLEAAPLGPQQKRNLQRSIAKQRERIRKMEKEFRESKKEKAKKGSGN